MSCRIIPDASSGCPPLGMSFHPRFPFRQPTPIMQLTAIAGAVGGWEENLKTGITTADRFAQKVAPFCAMLVELNRMIADDRGWDGGVYPVTEEFTDFVKGKES